MSFVIEPNGNIACRTSGFPGAERYTSGDAAQN
jgi:hypothetical protein